MKRESHARGGALKIPPVRILLFKLFRPPDTPSMTTQSQCHKNSGDHGALWAQNFQGLGEITCLGLKIERKNTNQCSSALRKEY